MKIFKGIKNCYTLHNIAQGSMGSTSIEKLSHIENAVIVEDQGKVVWVGPESNFSAASDGLGIDGSAEVVNLDCETVLPAFVECHTHSIFAGDRSNEFEMRNQGATYLEIAKAGGGILSTVNATRATSESDLLLMAQKRVDLFVEQGVTSLEVKSGYGLSHDAEIKMLKVARSLNGPKVIATYLGPHAVPKELSKEEYLASILEKTLPEVVQKKLADRADIFIEDGFFSLEEGREYLMKAQSMGLSLTGHVEQITNQGGARLLADLGANSVDHLVEASSSDVEILAEKKGTVSVLLPAADYYLKMDYPPARGLLDAGACVALATDFNPGSSPTQSLNFVGVLARLLMKMSLPEVIAAYTVNAAKALELERERGSLSVGKVCDFVGFNCSIDQLFYQVGFHPVSFCYREGSLLWRNQNLTS